MRRIVCLLCFLLPLAASAQQKKIVCWTNDHGHKMCGDTVPPEYVSKERQVLNKEGIVVDTLSRQKTPEEIAADARKQEQAEAAQKQADYDAYLVQTYRSVDDLEAAREDRMTTLDSRVHLSEKSVADGEAGLKQLNEQLAASQEGGKPADPKLQAKVKAFEKDLAANRKALETFRAERNKTAAKFDSDIARYRQLRGLPPIDPVKLVADAQNFFSRWQALKQANDPAAASLYGRTAVVRNSLMAPDGTLSSTELIGAKWKDAFTQSLAAAKAKNATDSYRDVKYEVEGSKVRVHATRVLPGGKAPVPFAMLVGQTATGQWQIYEEQSGAAAYGS